MGKFQAAFGFLRSKHQQSNHVPVRNYGKPTKREQALDYSTTDGEFEVLGHKVSIDNVFKALLVIITHFLNLRVNLSSGDKKSELFMLFSTLTKTA